MKKKRKPFKSDTGRGHALYDSYMRGEDVSFVKIDVKKKVKKRRKKRKIKKTSNFSIGVKRPKD